MASLTLISLSMLAFQAFLVMSPFHIVSTAQEGEVFRPPTDGNRGELAPAMLIFGDSLVDNGNNNNLPSIAKANYCPYGIDFAAGPTGRFSNGYTIVDEIAELLGLPLIPPHAQASGEGLLHGVNYASAAAGILDVTGRNFVGRIPFNQQISNFEATLGQITVKLGVGSIANTISHCIFFVGMGSNDYLNNYLNPSYGTRIHYNGEQFAELLAQQYTHQLIKLYNLGARKVVIAGVGLLGCIPNFLARNLLCQCSLEVDILIAPFRSKTKTMVSNFNANFPGANFIYADTYSMFAEILANPVLYGFTVTEHGCCGVGKNHGLITCLPLQIPCLNRDQYVYWDAFHPTAAVSILLARWAFNGDTDFVFPMNIHRLAMLDLES